MEPLGSELFRQSAASYERTFWSPGTDENGKETIVRDRRVQSFPDTLEIEDGCTLGLQQGGQIPEKPAVWVTADEQLSSNIGMIEEAFLRDMERNGLRTTRSFSFKSYTIAEQTGDSDDHPVTVELTKGPTTEGGSDGGEVVQVKCKYLVGCDGGRSAVRHFGVENHGLSFDGDLLSTLWGAGDFGE